MGEVPGVELQTVNSAQDVSRIIKAKNRDSYTGSQHSMHGGRNVYKTVAAKT